MKWLPTPGNGNRPSREWLACCALIFLITGCVRLIELRLHIDYPEWYYREPPPDHYASQWWGNKVLIPPTSLTSNHCLMYDTKLNQLYDVPCQENPCTPAPTR